MAIYALKTNRKDTILAARWDGQQMDTVPRWLRIATELGPSDNGGGLVRLNFDQEHSIVHLFPKGKPAHPDTCLTARRGDFIVHIPDSDDCWAVVSEEEMLRNRKRISLEENERVVEKRVVEKRVVEKRAKDTVDD